MRGKRQSGPESGMMLMGVTMLASEAGADYPEQFHFEIALAAIARSAAARP